MNRFMRVPSWATRRRRSTWVAASMVVAGMLATGCSYGSLRSTSVVDFGNPHKASIGGTNPELLHDLALITGTLPNGMRYYIRSNPFPAKRAHLWLAVNAGSINEDDDQRGFAHFLEHMAFNGTTNFPGNSVIDFVERSGMTFGPDLNAYTSFEETVYQLTIPTDDKAIFTSGLQVVDDWASGRILMDSVDVVAERGVVLGEWRVRLPDPASKRFQMDQLSRVYGAGSIFVRRFPIGDPELLKAATPAPLLRFYHDWYRPDLMAVIAVGDFDAKAVEKEILKRFGRIKPPANMRTFERPVVTSSSETIVHSFADKVRPSIELAWPAVPLASDPEVALRQELIEQLALPYLQRTFAALSKKDRRSFAAATIRRVSGVTRRSQERLVLQLVASPDSIMNGMRVALTEVERVAQHGISDVVLEREKLVLLRRYTSDADGSASIASRSYVQKYINHYLTGSTSVLLGPAQSLVLVERILPTITSNDIAQSVQGWRNDAGRVATVMQSMFGTVSKIPESDVTGLLRDVAAQSLATASSADGLVGSPTTLTESRVATLVGASTDGLSTADKPRTASVISTKYFAKTDITIWTLSNGARVVYKRNASEPDNVIIRAHSLGGNSLLPDSVFASPARLVGMLMTASGGFGGVDHESLQQQSRTTGLNEFRVGLNTFDEEIVIGGSPRELTYLFQTLYLQFTAPTVDTIALDDWRRNGVGTLSMSLNDRYAAGNSGHRRLVGPSVANVPFIDLAQAMRVYQDRFGDASDFTFYIAGPSRASDVLPLVTQYVATLPSTNRTVREVPRDFKVPLRKEKIRKSGVNPRLGPEKATMSLVFSGAMPHDSIQYLEGTEELSAASWILGRRLMKLLREEMGVTYSVSAPSYQYWTPDPRYVVSINVVTAPNMLDTTVNAVLQAVDDFRKQGPTDEELAMAQSIRVHQRENASQNNSWWINELEVLDRVGMSYNYLETNRAIKPLTKEQIRAAAQTYFPEKIYILNAVKPR